ncbi:MAG: DUF3386 domain-containing protein [Oculatellaceae cyanobacterium Prado106]|jgi:hypothetical protein|nr:DUF3386 domain-containing protein [Oculatellaceae cyanobacterium Prado106]
MMKRNWIERLRQAWAKRLISFGIVSGVLAIALLLLTPSPLLAAPIAPNSPTAVEAAIAPPVQDSASSPEPVAESVAESTTELVPTEEAKALFKTAYDRRYTWDENFPGYEADVAVKYKDSYVQGFVRLMPDFQVATKNIPNYEVYQMIAAQLQMSATQMIPASFEDMHGASQFAQVPTPPSAAIIIQETAQETAQQMGQEMAEEMGQPANARYQIKNQEIVQVNRDLGEVSIEVKTLHSMKLPEGYLLNHFQVIFRDPKTAEILEQDDVQDQYQKVGAYYLLSKREIRHGASDRLQDKLYAGTTLRFSNFRFLTPEEAAPKVEVSKVEVSQD